MGACPSCATDVPDGNRFCGCCGRAVGTAATDTTKTIKQDGAGHASHVVPAQVRFLPGAVLARRYRIVALVGRGGMGEVYRADDLKLGRPVALKFLAAEVEQEPSRLDRFLDEARTALKVTHPNVCRVHDIGEGDGRHYLSMEYVDGEDLASLLRRIERFPRDKAVQIARQICAGLGAAHAEGVLHRDLKPANVMIDGRGRAKITDFGLAALTTHVARQEARAGTPLYMSPEQHAAGKLTVKSDIYALGLVLYELFTGRRAFEAASLSEIRRLQEESSPVAPSAHVEGLDPSVERVILRCLARDPDRRPGSALEVAAALPGGDPLGDVLAAGETPSPELVAASGGKGALRRPLAATLLALGLAGLLLVAYIFGELSLLGQVRQPKSPQALADRAQEIVRLLGYDTPPEDRAYWYVVDYDYLAYVRDDASSDRWDRLAVERPGPYFFHYRQSPVTMVTHDADGRVRAADPPADIPGMVDLVLDGQGRLDSFAVVPGPRDRRPGPPPAFDWSPVFEAAGLEIGAFEPVDPSSTPVHYCERRFAWRGGYPGQDRYQLVVEGCEDAGRPNYFEIVYPWSRTDEPTDPAELPSLSGVIVMVAVVGAVVLARRNVRRGRGDRSGAARFGLFMVALWIARWVLTAAHVPMLWEEFRMLVVGVGLALSFGVLTWLAYLAVEPFMRRYWPESLVSWSRLLAGRFRDPLVGSHLLVGFAVGTVLTVLLSVRRLIPGWLGMESTWPPHADTDALKDARALLANLFEGINTDIQIVLVSLLLLTLLFLVFRNRWVAIATSVVILALMDALNSWGEGYFSVRLACAFIFSGTSIYLLTRFGPLAAIAAHFIMLAPFRLVFTLHLDSWLGNSALLSLLLVSGLMVYAFRVSVGHSHPAAASG